MELLTEVGYSSHRARHKVICNGHGDSTLEVPKTPAEIRGVAATTYRGAVTTAYHFYKEMRKVGIAREQARAILPTSLLTRFYLGGTLRDWCGFLTLRTTKEGVQEETKYVAEKIQEQLTDLWPEAMNALMGGKDD